MNTEPNSLRKPALVAVGAMAVLLLGAIIYYKERILFGDAAFIGFNIVNYQSLSIQEHRYGSFITQLFPYIGQYFHLPLKYVLLAYSVSFNLFYCSVVLALVYRFRQYALALVMALYYFLFVTESYFWTNNEIHQAVAWMFLLLAYALSANLKGFRRYLFLPVFTLLAFLTIFTHVVVVMPLTFLWVWYLLNDRNNLFSGRRVWILTSILIALLAVKLLISSSVKDSYEGQALHDATHFSIKDIINSFSTPVISLFLYRCVSLYWPAILILVAGIVSLVRARKTRPLIWLLLCAVGYFVFIGLTYGKFDSELGLYHIESEWAALSIIIATPFVFCLLPAIKTRYAIMVMVAIFIVRIAYISGCAQDFVWRQQFKEQVLGRMKQEGITKLAIYNPNDIRKRMRLDWAIAEESLLMSIAEGDDTLRSFRFMNKDDKDLIDVLSRKRNGISFNFLFMRQAEMNSEYFRPDTTSTYTMTSLEDFMK